MYREESRVRFGVTSRVAQARPMTRVSGSADQPLRAVGDLSLQVRRHVIAGSGEPVIAESDPVNRHGAPARCRIAATGNLCDLAQRRQGQCAECPPRRTGGPRGSCNPISARRSGLPFVRFSSLSPSAPLAPAAFLCRGDRFPTDSVRGPEERPPWFAHLLPLKRCCRLQACPARVRAPQVGFVSPLYIVMPRTVSATPSCEWARQRHWTAAGCGTRSWSPSRALAPISVAVGLGRLPSRRT
jgi:hypothetical protein